MKLYNIEAIKGDNYGLYGLYVKSKYTSDVLFLREFLRTLSTLQERSIGSGSNYLNAFYDYYVSNGGDARFWVQRTIENTVTYTDILLETWLELELEKLTTKSTKKTNARKIMTSLMAQIREQSKLGIDVETILKDLYNQVAKDYPTLKYSAFRSAYYYINPDY